MLKEVIEDALERGERLKSDIVRQILSSSTLNELLNNHRFADTIAKVIQSKEIISRVIRRNAVDALKLMHIPSKTDIRAYELRVQKLERQIDSLGRAVMSKQLKHSGNSNGRARRKKR